jgi:hypothetical protein
MSSIKSDVTHRISYDFVSDLIGRIKICYLSLLTCYAFPLLVHVEAHT